MSDIFQKLIEFSKRIRIILFNYILDIYPQVIEFSKKKLITLFYYLLIVFIIYSEQTQGVVFRG